MISSKSFNFIVIHVQFRNHRSRLFCSNQITALLIFKALEVATSFFALLCQISNAIYNDLHNYHIISIVHQNFTGHQQNNCMYLRWNYYIKVILIIAKFELLALVYLWFCSLPLYRCLHASGFFKSAYFFFMIFYHIC